MPGGILNWPSCTRPHRNLPQINIPKRVGYPSAPQTSSLEKKLTFKIVELLFPGARVFDP
jgi:hypothetical protein